MTAETIAAAAAASLEIVARESVLATAVFLAVWPVVRLVRRYAPAAAEALWSLVFFRFVLPPGLGHRYSVLSLVANLVPERTAGLVSHAGTTMAFRGVNPAHASGLAPALSASPWIILLATAWAAGCGLAAWLYLHRALAVRRLLAGAVEIDSDTILSISAAWRRRLGISRPVRLVTAPEPIAPFTTGVLRPTVFLPEAVLRREALVEPVLAHELAHVARWDALRLRLQHLVEIVYFFHPVAWLAASALGSEREHRSDAAVVTTGRLSRRGYADALLEVCRLPLTTVGAPAAGSAKRRMIMRIEALRNLRTAAPLGRLATGLLTLLVALVLVPAGAIDAPSADPVSVSPDPPAATTLTAGEPAPGGPAFANPVPGSRVSWAWGLGRDPFSGKVVQHRGTDLATPAGTLVLAPGAGVVTVATTEYRPEPGAGTVVVVDHGGDIETFYAHLGSLRVAVGDLVRQGDVLAEVGSSGRSTGPHLHFEVHRDGVPVDPRRLVNELR